VLVNRHADLIATDNLPTFAPGLGFDVRVSLLQPGAESLGVLLAGMAARPLGAIAPAIEILAHGPHRHVDAELLAHQVTDGTPGPQRGGDAQLGGTVAVDEMLDMAGLLVVECAARAQQTSGPLVGQGVEALAAVGGPPTADRLCVLPALEK
jgi:hypothetical protein